jgi:hypothetical protein
MDAKRSNSSYDVELTSDEKQMTLMDKIANCMHTEYPQWMSCRTIRKRFRQMYNIELYTYFLNLEIDNGLTIIEMMDEHPSFDICRNDKGKIYVRIFVL